MKIFVTSDIHGNSAVLRYLKDVPKDFPDIDMIAVCGDVGGKRGYTLKELSETQRKDYAAFLDVIKDIYHNFGVSTVYILGNDDWFEAEDDSSYLKSPDVYGDEKNPVLFIPFELVHITPFTTNREANENKIEYELSKLTKRYTKEELQAAIIIAHDVPHMACDEVSGSGANVGSVAIRNFIEECQPKAWFGGHIHEAYGTKMVGKTRVFNCACMGSILQGFVFDTDALEYSCVQYP